MRNSFCFSSETLLKNIYLWDVEWLKLLSIKDVFGAVLHKLSTCAPKLSNIINFAYLRLDWNEFRVTNILLTIVRSEITKKTLFHFFQSVYMSSWIISNNEFITFKMALSKIQIGFHNLNYLKIEN